MHALVAGGADILELGIPFSDPEAEGPAIQASSERALANGVSLKTVLSIVSEFREKDQDTPIVLMGYLNSILAMPDFAARAAAAGVDGLIMVNLPPEEAHSIKPELLKHDIDLIFLLAPTTTDTRAHYILSQASGFAYYVSHERHHWGRSSRHGTGRYASGKAQNPIQRANLCWLRNQRSCNGEGGRRPCRWCCRRKCAGQYHG